MKNIAMTVTPTGRFLGSFSCIILILPLYQQH
jgi:hypothetical protein